MATNLQCIFEKCQLPADGMLVANSNKNSIDITIVTLPVCISHATALREQSGFNIYVTPADVSCVLGSPLSEDALVISYEAFYAAQKEHNGNR